MLNPYCIKRTLWVNNRCVYISGGYDTLLDENELKEFPQTFKGDNFDSLWDFVKEHEIYCSMWKRTLFSKKRSLHFEEKQFLEDKVYSWEYLVEATPIKHFRIRDLQWIDAEKAVRYCAERGSSIILEK